MGDVDRGVGGRTVPSSGDCVDCDGVVGARIQTSDGGRGLRARDGELLRSLSTWNEKARELKSDSGRGSEETGNQDGDGLVPP